MENDIRRIMKDLGISEYEKPIHLMMIGRPGSGKTSLAGLFITGESDEGQAGPDPGTVHLQSTLATANKIPFVVHDTRGLEDCDDNEDKHKHLQKSIKEMKEIVNCKHCIVVVCIPFNDRFCHHKKILDITNSLSPNDTCIWKTTIIAITHYDVEPPEAKDLLSDAKEKRFDELKARWEINIKEKLESLHVDEETLKQLKICYTGRVEEQNIYPVSADWLQDLMKNLLDLLSSMDSCLLELLTSYVDDDVNRSYVDQVYNSLSPGDKAVLGISACGPFVGGAVYGGLGGFGVGVAVGGLGVGAAIGAGVRAAIGAGVGIIFAVIAIFLLKRKLKK